MARPDPMASCRFFSADDALRIALQAYYAASRNLEPPPGEPFYDEDGAPWCSTGDFADQFFAEIEARIGLVALDHLGEFHVRDSYAFAHKIAAELSPGKITPIIANWDRIKAEVEADVYGLQLNHLPPGDNKEHNHLEQGDGHAG